MNKKAWIVLLVALVWGIGCWWWYVHKIKGKHTAAEEVTIPQINRPLSFRLSTDSPILGKSFAAYRDSIVSTVGKNNLQITGLYFSDEKNTTSFHDLGAARASKVKELFKGKIPDSQIATKSQLDTFNYPAGGPDVEVAQLIVVTNATLQPVEENGNHVIIYLPSKKIDSVVITYLKQLAAKLKASKKSTLTIIGYSDNKGTSKSNYNAGLKRAKAIKSELVKYGVNPKHMTAKSDGEKNPIASNDTEEGRQKNRRVEITINNP